jgi:methylphosphotriester-DNA--protein-cysteine methyltransferase
VLKQFIPAAYCFALVFSSTPILLKADTLSQENARDTGTAAAAVDSLSADTAARTLVQKTRLGTVNKAKNRRDSTLRALLATLEKDDSLNALSQRDSAAAALRREKPSTTVRFSTITQWVAKTARRHPMLFAMAGIPAFFILLWLIVARIAAKKADRRFMTTTRLSLMDGEVRRACVHIEKHYADPGLTPVSVCAAIVTGEPFLEALFQRELGMSIAAYIEQTRIHHAKRIAGENPSADASTVASQTGFPDAASLTALFKKTTGTEFDAFREGNMCASQ